MEGSTHFQIDKKPVDKAQEQSLPNPETMNWEELSAILRRAELSWERMQAAHEVIIMTSKEENWRTATPEQKQASDAALAAEYEAFEIYATAAARRNEAMTKMDSYLHALHKADYEISDLEQFLLEKRQRLEGQMTNPDETISLETRRAIAELDVRLAQVELEGDAARNRLEVVLDLYHDTLTGKIDEAMAAK